MCQYDRSFLEEKGYFERAVDGTISIDGRSIAFDVDPNARLAYVEDLDRDLRRTIVSEHQSLGRTVDYYWFWNADAERVAVYSRYGERQWFRYDESVDHAPEARDSKRERLATIDDGLHSLFDVRRTVDRLYRNLWEIRLGLARALEPPAGTRIGDEERLMAAQRAIDRLLFCYFLIERNVVHGVDEAGNRVGIGPRAVFDRVLADGDFHSFLVGTVFDHLTSEEWTEFEASESVTVAVPYLNERLFRDRRIDTDDGETIRERELDGTRYDWTRLVDELDRYDWSLEASPAESAPRSRDELETSLADEDRAGSANEVTPAVLGHVFEKFVVTLSELSDGDAVTLRELEEMDVSASGEQLREGNRRVGAYYTPNYVAVENTRETLWHRVRTRLADEYDVDPSAIRGTDAFFERVGDGQSSLPLDPGDVESVLADVRVVDPATGGGAFLMTAGVILERWRSRCAPDRARSELRREIARESLYGVDLLDGAVEVCRLRLRLWLVGAVDLDDGRPDVEPLPNVDCNIRQGNSLVGIAADPDARISRLEFEWIDGETTTYPEAVRDYGETVAEYRTASGERADELRARLAAQRRRLEDELDRAYARQRDVSVEETVESHEEYATVVDGVSGRVKLNLEFDAPMTDAERRRVSELGFREQRNWETTAYRADIRHADDETVERTFALMDDRGTITVERPLTAADLEGLDPFHWIFEFPTADLTTGANSTTAVSADDQGGAFDVVLGNPPHGSSLGPVEKSILEDAYSLIEDGREVAKLFTERSWELAAGELSYVVPKPSTYNSNWADFRAFCRPKLYRGLDLGKAFGDVDHEQVTVHLSRAAVGDEYLCGPLEDGDYRLDDGASVDRSFAEALGTLPVSFSARERSVAAGLGAAEYPTIDDAGVDAGRGASTAARVNDSDAPIAYNGRQVQRYFTRPATARVETNALSEATRSRVESPKVMAQNIVAHRKNPYDHVVVAAVYDPVESYSFETVTNVVLPDESDLTLPALAVLLNTRFVNWFAAVSLFNRAIRDMHLDAYFLERLVIPEEITEPERNVLEDLYGLLAITAVPTEYDALPDAREAYVELQSIANALTYELYLRTAPEAPLETDLAELLADVLGTYELEFENWYADHLRCGDERQLRDRFRENEDLFVTATEVVDALRTEEVSRELRAIAAHPWVDIMERGRHVGTDRSRPLFGPVEKS